MSRRECEESYLDFYRPVLMGLSVAILLLCAADAALTLRLLPLGARELNPLMNPLITADVRAFVLVKMACTGIGLILLVPLSNLRAFSRLRVRQTLYVVLGVYLSLIAYELVLLYLFS